MEAFTRRSSRSQLFCDEKKNRTSLKSIETTGYLDMFLIIRSDYFDINIDPRSYTTSRDQYQRRICQLVQDVS